MNNPHKINGKRPQGIYSQMMAMEDRVYTNSISIETLNKLFKQCTPEVTRKFNHPLFYGTPGKEINIIMNEDWYNPEYYTYGNK